MAAPPDWADDDWDRARQQVAEAISRFSPEDGHSMQMADEHLNPRPAVLLSGCTSGGIESVLQLMSFIGRVFPHSYGELVVLDDASPSLLAARCYRLEAGACSTA